MDTVNLFGQELSLVPSSWWVERAFPAHREPGYEARGRAFPAHREPGCEARGSQTTCGEVSAPFLPTPPPKSTGYYNLVICYDRKYLCQQFNWMFQSLSG